MKRLIPHICIVALIAAIGLTTACSKNGSGKITAKYRFTGTPSATAKGTVSRAASAVEGTEDFDEFYTKLGAKKGSFTPTEMILMVSHLTIARERGYYICDLMRSRHEEDPVLIDLAKPITVTAEEMEPGFYDYLQFSFVDVGAIGPEAPEILTTVTFQKPSTVDLQTHAFTSRTLDLGDAYGYREEKPGYITAAIFCFQPHIVDLMYGAFTTGTSPCSSLGTGVGHIGQLFFVGDKHIVARYNGQDQVLSDFIPNAVPAGVTGAISTGIIAPFEGVDVPEDATAVRFEIVWDITDVIEWYEGPDNTTTDDDIFVLRNGFWNGFSVKAVIEQ